ncbi:MAG: hypothetical protein ACD_54C00735G0005 [uncultured bacterium]|nr:MAG: hypothetical protein ACD_54C00735G0005 [uncultured bacterium]
MGESGFIQMLLTQAGTQRVVWQQVSAGEVQGYLEADGSAVLLAETYEMAVVDPAMLAAFPALDAQTGGPA